MLFRMVKWTPSLDLRSFYNRCKQRGFINNASEKALINSLRKEREWCVWILYYNNTAVASVAAHTIEEGYRVCARTCVLSDLLPFKTLRTRKQIASHDHITAQYLMPTCIEWAKEPMYITSHPSNVGTQRLVHTIWGPTMEKAGVVTRAFEKQYKNHMQTFWLLHKDVFMQQLAKNRWKYQFEHT